VSLNAGSVLILSTNPIEVRALSGLLRKHDYQVQALTDSLEALKQIFQTPPDLLLLALDVGDMPANSFCEHVRKHDSTRDLPILGLASSALLADRRSLYLGGCTDYILRPLQAQEILARVSVQVRLRHLQNALPPLPDGGAQGQYAWTDTKQLETVFTELLSNSLKLEERVAQRTEQLSKINKVYERFVPREFLDFLQKSSITEVKPGDQIQREMTVLFLDIRDFTSVSEKMTPQQNFNYLNAYLNKISPVIHEHRGFIDKFIGDAVLALFPHRPEDALQAAIAMRLATSSHNLRLRARSLPPIKVGIGIHTGKLMLGVLGDAERMQSTVISDAVNLASRLESLTKIYGASIAISKHTLFRISNIEQYYYRSVGKIQVKGKKTAISVYEVFNGDNETELKQKLKTKTDFEKGLIEYQARKFAEASVCFNRVLQINQNDKAARLYLTSAAHCMVHGVPEDWDGVEVLREK